MNYSSYERRSKQYIYYLAFNANLGAIGAGIFFVALNACIWEVMFVVSSGSFFINLNEAVLSAAIPFGAVFGAILASYTVNKYGRRKTMIYADFLTVVGCLLSISSNLIIMLVGRIICGIVVGINYMVIPLYLREISPPDMSGRTGSYFKIFFTLGLLLSFAISLGLENPPTSDDITWRIIFTLPCIFGLIRIINFLVWIRMETPKYYMEREEEYKAILALGQIFRDDQVEQVYRREKMFEASKLTDIFGSKYRSQSFVVILIIFGTELMGANALNFYTSIIFLNKTSESRDDYAQARTLNIIFAFVRLSAALLGRFLIDKIGRRPLLLYGNIILILLAFFICFSDAVMFLIGQQTLVLIYSAIQSLTFALVLPVYAAELLPSFGIGLQVVIQMLCILLVTLYFLFVGVEYSFLIFGLIGLFSFYPIFRFAKETRGRTLNEVYRMFQAEKGSGLLDTEVEHDGINELSY